ncbi:MAG: DUF4440 domain-containing protein [Planctomycetota bacterium]
MNPLIPDPANIPSLPPASPVERFLLEEPLPVIVLLMVLGVVVSVVLLQRHKLLPAAGAAGAAAFMAVVVFLVARQVETTRERLSELATRLVAATTGFDEPELTTLLYEDVRVTGRAIPEIESREALITVGRQTLARYNIVGQVEILEIRAGLDNEVTARTQLRIRATPGVTNVPTASWWQITWQKDAGRWVATKVEALWIQGAG